MPDLQNRFLKFSSLLQSLDAGFYADIDRGAAILNAAVAVDRTILACGNGGSSSDASHFVAEFVGRFMKERRGLPAISLSAENASITAIANDYGYDAVFARQVEAFGRPGDVLVGISTSGKSPNVLKALSAARDRKMTTIALVGAAGLAEPVADLVIAVPSRVTYEIQEVHMMILHSWCAIVEEGL